MNNQPIMQNQLHRKLFKSSIKQEDKQLAGERLTLKMFNICFLRASYWYTAFGKRDTCSRAGCSATHPSSALLFLRTDAATQNLRVILQAGSSCRCCGGQESLPPQTLCAKWAVLSYSIWRKSLKLRFSSLRLSSLILLTQQAVGIPMYTGRTLPGRKSFCLDCFSANGHDTFRKI